MDVFMTVFSKFILDVEEDMARDSQIQNIDGHMQDLRRNALKEYEEVRLAEHVMVRKERKLAADSKEPVTIEMLKNSDELNRHYLAASHAHQGSNLLSMTQSTSAAQLASTVEALEQLNELNTLDPKEKKKLKKKQKKRDKKFKQQMALFSQFDDDSTQVSADTLTAAGQDAKGQKRKGK